MADHLAWPARMDHTGRLATVDRDSLAGTAQAVRMTLETQPGDRLIAEDFGVPDPSHVGVNEQDIRQAISDWVPRARIDITVDPPGGDGRQLARVVVIGVR